MQNISDSVISAVNANESEYKGLLEKLVNNKHPNYILVPVSYNNIISVEQNEGDRFSANVL